MIVGLIAISISLAIVCWAIVALVTLDRRAQRQRAARS